MSGVVVFIYVLYKIIEYMWEGAMRAELRGLIDLNAFEFLDVLNDGFKCSVGALWKAGHHGNDIKPSARKEWAPVR